MFTENAILVGVIREGFVEPRATAALTAYLRNPFQHNLFDNGSRRVAGIDDVGQHQL